MVLVSKPPYVCSAIPCNGTNQWIITDLSTYHDHIPSMMRMRTVAAARATRVHMTHSSIGWSPTVTPAICWQVHSPSVPVTGCTFNLKVTAVSKGLRCYLRHFLGQLPLRGHPPPQPSERLVKAWCNNFPVTTAVGLKYCPISTEDGFAKNIFSI